ncbi:hypothetical protein [Actinomyces wuliandei]|uniref:hypothetical protein n=1 Tax=Actinomyces wuliandei TaxID=2057743 RepID=UPI00111A8819|nr:hypothetical protein [Actinomyces wuliandei]
MTAKDATRKVTLRLSAELAGRARSAWRAENSRGTKYASFNDWLTAAVATAVTDAERRHNNGNPFPPTPTGVIPAGRPGG